MKHTSLQVTPEFGCMCVRASTAPAFWFQGSPVGLPGSWQVLVLVLKPYESWLRWEV